MTHPLPTDPQITARLAHIRDRLALYCGVYLDDARLQALRSAIQHDAERVGRTLEAQLAILSATTATEALHDLAEAVLNHETIFFRNQRHMHALRTVVFPELHQRLPAGEPITIWSAGCATGEEPYSIAMTALEALGDPLPRPVMIWATDLSAAALDRARSGRYSGRTLMNLSSAQRARFFTPLGATLCVNDTVRRLVRFEQRNLLAPFPPALRNLHAIFCQNVTIYFQLATCRNLMARFDETLADGGMLFLGFSETLWNIYDRFRWREVGGSFVYYKESQSPTPAGVAALRERAGRTRPTAPLTPVDPADRPANGAQRAERAEPLRRPAEPFTGSAVVERGRHLLDTGNIDAALELFAAAPLSGAHAPAILALAARAHADRGDLDLAAAEAHRAIELNPLTTEAYVLLGMIYARQGQPLDAARQLERARYLDVASPLIAFHLAESYRQAGKWSSALREYQTALRHLAQHPPGHLIDGVAVDWLNATCRRYVAQLAERGG
jgi:chemotaxis protein methyltransferase CheR